MRRYSQPSRSSIRWPLSSLADQTTHLCVQHCRLRTTKAFARRACGKSELGADGRRCVILRAVLHDTRTNCPALRAQMGTMTLFVMLQDLRAGISMSSWTTWRRTWPTSLSRRLEPSRPPITVLQTLSPSIRRCRRCGQAKQKFKVLDRTYGCVLVEKMGD